MEVRKYYLTYIYEKDDGRYRLLRKRRFKRFIDAWRYGMGSKRPFNVGVEVIIIENQN